MSTEIEPLKISWSQLRSFEHCKQQAFLYRTKKRSPVSNIRTFFPGTVVDRAMRIWLSQDEKDKGFMAAQVHQIMEEEEQLALSDGSGIVKWKSLSDREETFDWCVELVNRLEPILFQYVVPYNYDPAVRFEAPVMVPYLDGTLTQISLVGEMDLFVQEDENKFAVWDLKGTKDDSYWRKTLGQLQFYDIAVQIMYGNRCYRTGLIQPMCKERVMQFSFSSADYSQMWARINRYAISRWSDDVAPKADSVGCSFCDVNHACAKFKVEGGSRNQISFGRIPSE